MLKIDPNNVEIEDAKQKIPHYAFPSQRLETFQQW